MTLKKDHLIPAVHTISRNSITPGRRRMFERLGYRCLWIYCDAVIHRWLISQLAFAERRAMRRMIQRLEEIEYGIGQDGLDRVFERFCISFIREGRHRSVMSALSKGSSED